MSEYVPDSLIPEILSKLPVKSLLRCRCVCKQWRCLISSPHFINTHLSHSLSSTPLLHLRHRSTSIIPDDYTVYLDPPSNTQLTFVKKLEVPIKSRSGNRYRAVGFCNGVFCLSDDNNVGQFTETIILWNPAIRKSLSLPMPPTVSFRLNAPCWFCHGFGVDPKTHDFKVVRAAYMYGSFSAAAVEVYSLSTGVWKTLNSMDINSQIVQNFVAGIHVCLNGNIHWISYVENEGGDSNSLLLFDLSNDTFSEMGLPRGLRHVDHRNLFVTLRGEQISVIWHDNGHYRDELRDRCVVWVMNQYGNPETWTEKFVVEKPGISRALGFRGNGELLLKWFDGNHLLSYDPDSKQFKDLDIHSLNLMMFLTKYVESLVLLG